MVRVRLLAVLLAGTALLVPATSADAALETVVQDDAALLHRPTSQVRASLQKLRSLGVDRVRLTANWSVLTPAPTSRRRPSGFEARDPAAYPQALWRALDDAVRLAQETGLKAMIDIGYWAPRWATTHRRARRARTNIDASDFADFAAAVARRYSGRYTPPVFVPPPPPPSPDQTLLDELLGGPSSGPSTPTLVPLPAVDQFVLWNEPNHPALLLPQWKGKGRRARPASPAIYARMARRAYAAAKPLRPDAAFLLGNTASDGSREGAGRGAVSPLRFLRGVACVNRRLRPLRSGRCRNFKRLPGDGWAHHPYTRQLRPDSTAPFNRPDTARIGTLNRLSRLLRRLAARGRIAKALRRIYINEFGYETGRIAGRPTLTQGQQARWLTWAEYLSSRVPGVVSFSQFLLRDLPRGPVRTSPSRARCCGQNYSGLETVAGNDKLAAKSFTAGLFALRRSTNRVLLWGRLRLGPGVKAISIERQRRNRDWRVMRRLDVGGQDSFAVTTRFVAHARYRLRWPRADGKIPRGLPISPVKPFRAPRR